MTDNAPRSLRSNASRSERPAPYRKDQPAPRKKGKPAPRQRRPQTTQTGMVYLRVNQGSLMVLTPPTANQPNPQPLPPPNTTEVLNVIVASLRDMQSYAGNSVDWLTEMARRMLDPMRNGILHTFQSHTVQYWLARPKDNTWRAVQAGEPLRATIYEYCPPNQQFMQPTWISLRNAKSLTTATTQNQSAAFRTALSARHPACIISGNPVPELLTASHLMPKRLGDAAIQSVFTTFTGLNTPVRRFHEFIGITLSKNLDALVDNYELGFWHRGGDNYEIHVFLDEAQQLNISGSLPTSRRDPLLFHHLINIQSQSKVANPPPGVFAWNYTQCVLTKFATDEYKGLANITHFDLPFRTEDDDDDDPEFDDPGNIEDPPYPSYLLDLAWSRRCQEVEEAEQRQDIERWRSVVS